jgi:predicted NAD-dependent protein-ADP-ribosyltransferase YbiA (DUF1768 family)
MGGSAYIDGVEYREFDNFYPISFEIDGKYWSSSEQAYQALKFDDINHIERIRNENDLSMIIHLGHVQYIKYIDGWDNTLINSKLKNNPLQNHSRINLMYRVNLEKFRQNPNIMELLVKTNGAIKCCGSSRFWNKWNGLILEEIRNILIPQKI